MHGVLKRGEWVSLTAQFRSASARHAEQIRGAARGLFEHGRDTHSPRPTTEVSGRKRATEVSGRERAGEGEPATERAPDVYD